MSDGKPAASDGAFGPLPYGPTFQRLLPPLHRGFREVNRLFTIPLFRSGLGVFAFSSPFAYVMVLRTTGRRSGLPREAPLGYGILDGCICCTAGFGPRTQWLLNIREDPRVEVLLPGGHAFAGIAEEVSDPDEWLRAFRQVMKGCGIVGGLTIGENPWRVSDEVLRRKGQGLPVVRIRPTDVTYGPADPGGWAWASLAVAGTLCATALLLGRRGRRGGKGVA